MCNAGIKELVEDERHGFAELARGHGFKDAYVMAEATWRVPRTRISWPNLKLDWFLTRDVDAELRSIGPFISDHRPFLVLCRLRG